LISRGSFVALQHRNYRLIWIGLFVSFSGSMMQNAALLWHVSLLVSPDRKGLALGMVGLVRVLPIMIFSMISGVVADAWDRRKLMLFTQIGATIVAAGLAILAFRGVTHVWPIYLLAALGSSVGAFDLPARGALVPTLVPREHLPNAISLNTIMFQTASVVGPSLGGILIANTGVGWVYVANAVSFAFVIVALLMMRRAGAPDIRDRIARRRLVARGAGRAAVRVPLAAHPIDDAARFLRDVLLVGDGAAADFRAGHPPGRRERLRLALRRARRRGDGDQRGVMAVGAKHRQDQ